MSRRSNRLAVALAVAAAVLAPAAVNAGGGAPTLQVSPNPAQVGDTVLISNTDDQWSTCEGGWVELFIIEGDLLLLTEELSPDGDGNWSFDYLATAPGSYQVAADCRSFDADGGLAVPAAQPDFEYFPETLVVNQTVTTLGPTTTTGPTTTVPAAPVSPAFTG